ncbi:hypothetical protein X961_5625 [Burkholderia pseudomallei MSHR5613]|nr:hypothetical protein X961_5625 [Burkholderia pseudomallei MSHR5613]
MVFVDQLAPQTKSGHTSLTVSSLNQIPSTREYFYRQFPTVFGCHAPLETLE